jgi:hypothetical protein
MEELFVFVHRQGSKRMIEIVVIEAMTVADLANHASLSEGYGNVLPAADLVFFGDSEAPASPHEHVSDCHRRHDGRIHLTKCHRIAVSVHYTHGTHSKDFPPGARIKAVKNWAVAQFNVPALDAAEHVLEIHGTKDRPNPSEPLSILVHGDGCKLVFDLVPDIRVEG